MRKNKRASHLAVCHGFFGFGVRGQAIPPSIASLDLDEMMNDRDANPPTGPHRLHPYGFTLLSHRNNGGVFKMRDRNHFLIDQHQKHMAIPYDEGQLE